MAPPAATEDDGSRYPDAVPVPDTGGATVSIAADTNSATGGMVTLNGHVLIRYKDRTLEADRIEYNEATGEAVLTGHVVVEGGENGEHIQASHGTYNIRSQTGRFYDVTGSIGLRPPTVVGPVPSAPRAVYANGNPFLFTARVLIKNGPNAYAFDHGMFTSCQMPHPDWLLSAEHFHSDGTTARAANTVFHLLGLPLVWLPYATHPVDTSSRQTGILIPDLGINSASKGDTIGEQIYWAIDRSTNMTVGTIYYSARGWERTLAFHRRGLGQDFARANYSSLQDRGYFPSPGTFVNQSGTDVVFSGRKDLLPAQEAPPDGSAPAASSGQARMAAEVEYLSSFPYREAFSSNFNQAVSSDVLSSIYATRQWNGMAAALEGDRYQGEKRIAVPGECPPPPPPIALPRLDFNEPASESSTEPLIVQPGNPPVRTPATPECEQQVRIFHAPAIEFSTTDQTLGNTHLEWSLDSSLTALKRTQPIFQGNTLVGQFDSGMVGRLDVHPEIALPFHFGDWNLRSSLAGRETFYTRSKVSTAPGVPGPVESAATLNREDFEATFDLRPPVLERTFDSKWLRRLLGGDVRHTIEPEITYRYVTGVDNFPQVLRFDITDVASDTNELEYGGTQRLFLRRSGGRPCRAAGEAADATEVLGSAGAQDDAVEDPGESTGRIDEATPLCGDREWISWRVAQKFFFDSHFGGAVTTTGPRDILATTLDFSGISFLTSPRNLSPIISRLRLRTSEKLDVEWDFDYDTVAGKYTANNFYTDIHWGDPANQSKRYIFAGLGYARLNAPARSYVEGVLSSVADFNQMRVLLGFGKPTRPGLSAAASGGIDLDLGSVQYGAIETSYNWNCCGLSVEYRKYELGTARNDNGYKFNFTLANIGSAGNLRHSEQVF